MSDSVCVNLYGSYSCDPMGCQTWEECQVPCVADPTFGKCHCFNEGDCNCGKCVHCPTGKVIDWENHECVDPDASCQTESDCMEQCADGGKCECRQQGSCACGLCIKCPEDQFIDSDGNCYTPDPTCPTWHECTEPCRNDETWGECECFSTDDCTCGNCVQCQAPNTVDHQTGMCKDPNGCALPEQCYETCEFGGQCECRAEGDCPCGNCIQCPNGQRIDDDGNCYWPSYCYTHMDVECQQPCIDEPDLWGECKCKHVSEGDVCYKCDAGQKFDGNTVNCIDALPECPTWHECTAKCTEDPTFGKCECFSTDDCTCGNCVQCPSPKVIDPKTGTCVDECPSGMYFYFTLIM